MFSGAMLARRCRGRRAFPTVAAVPAVSVIFAAVSGDDETRRFCHIRPVDVSGDRVIRYLSASVTDKIDVLVEIAFATIFSFVEFEGLDDAVPDELVDGGVCR